MSRKTSWVAFTTKQSVEGKEKPKLQITLLFAAQFIYSCLQRHSWERRRLLYCLSMSIRRRIFSVQRLCPLKTTTRTHQRNYLASYIATCSQNDLEVSVGKLLFKHDFDSFLNPIIEFSFGLNRFQMRGSPPLAHIFRHFQ